MPFTPYHFGWSALPGFFTRGRLDLTICAAANVLVDIEVLADNYVAPGWPVHQLWHLHTFLAGGAAGAALGALVYAVKPARLVCGKINAIFGFSFRPTLFSMILSGILGVWLHVLIDGFYHYDVQAFWPNQENFLIKWASGGFARIHDMQGLVIQFCLGGWILAGIAAAALFIKNRCTKRCADKARSAEP